VDDTGIDPELTTQLTDYLEVDMIDIDADRRVLRAETEALPAVDESGVSVAYVQVAAADGVKVPVRLYVPQARKGTGALLYIHGGGFVFGDLDSGHGDAVETARDLGVPVASVDYRLAPEHRYPAAVDDCVTALRWFREQCPGLGVDPGRVVVAGMSAGGCLAAALALRVRDAGDTALHFVLLEEPVTDDRLTTESSRTYVDTPCWRRPLAIIGWDSYLGPGLRGTDDVSPYAAPMRADDLSGFPPTSVMVAQVDPLRDEGIGFAQRLAAAGVPVELRLFPGTFHASSDLESQVSILQREHRRATLLRALA
jgi:acetyl esterase